MLKISKLKKILSWVLKISIVLIAYGFLYKQLMYGHDLKQVYYNVLKQPKSNSFFLLLAVVIGLMIINWGIESKKWQLLISKLIPVSFILSYKAIITGMTVSSFTPNRVGEFIGRVFFLPSDKRWEAIFVTIIGSISQLLVTLIVGIIACIFFIPFYFNGIIITSVYMHFAAIITGIMIVALLILAFYNLDLLLVIARKIGIAKTNPLIKYLRVFALYNYTSLSKILFLSFIRYMVFTTQFYILLCMFNVPITYHVACMLIALIFFIDTAIPTIVLTEWGVRASLSIFLFTLYFTQMGIPIPPATTFAIASASTLLWFINLVVPAIIGSIFVFQLKFDTN